MVVVNIQPKKEFKRPNISEKAYTGVCKQIKQFTDADGNEKVSLNTYGNENMKLIFDFDLFEMETGKAAMYDDIPVTISQFASYMSRKKGEEEWRNIIGSPKSQITGIVSALGLELKSDMETQYDLDNLVGNKCKVYVKDYTKKNADGTEETFSVIDKVSTFSQKDLEVLKEPIPNQGSSSSSKPAQESKESKEKKIEKESEIKSSTTTNSDGEEIETIDLSGDSNKEDENSKKLKELKDQLEKGLITQKGYDMAVEQLTGMDEIDKADLGDDV